MDRAKGELLKQTDGGCSEEITSRVEKIRREMKTRSQGGYQKTPGWD